MSIVYWWCGPAASVAPARKAFASARSASASVAWMCWAPTIAGTVASRIVSTDRSATPSVPAPITNRAIALAANSVSSIWRWPGVVCDRLRARSTRSRSDRPTGGLAAVTAAPPSSANRRSAAIQIWMAPACPHLPVSLPFSGQAPNGELGEEAELDHVVRSEQLDLAALQGHAVDAGAVGGSEVADSPGRSHPHDLGVPARDVRVAVDRGVEAAALPTDHDRMAVQDEGALREVDRRRRRAGVVEPH